MFEREKKLKKYIEELLSQGYVKEAEISIKEYEKLNPNGLEINSMKSIIEFMKGNYTEAEEILIKIYNKYEFNFDINYNLAMINYYSKSYEKTIKYLIKALFIDSSKSDMIQQIILDIPGKYLSEERLNREKEKMKLYFCNYKKLFPEMNKEQSYIGKEIEIHKESYYCGLYDYYFAERDGIVLDKNITALNLIKTELLPGEKVTFKKFKVHRDGILPIMLLSIASIKISINDEYFNLNTNLVNRFYYYPLRKGDEVVINSDKEFILGEYIYTDGDKNKPKLILNIFVDGLSQKFLKKNGLEKSMPNTYKFFKKGTICNNTHVSGEWTYVSMASFYTGKYTKNHRVFHPEYDCDNLLEEELYPEVLKRNGYFCARIDGDWRSTPAYGYVKGMNRVLYQPSVRGMHCDEVIMESIEHIEAFKTKNNFLWICLPDLHDIADEFETRISTQVKSSIKDRQFITREETSVRKKYDKNKINRYAVQAKRIDTYLSILYKYIEDNYSDDEILISLFSDHGQGYFVDTENFLDDGRTSTAMMFRGENIPKGECNELVQGVDLFPIIFKSIGINDFKINDGNLPKYFGGDNERNYTITESIFPKSPYRIAINDLKHKFFFETVELCTDDGMVKLENFKVKLINKENNKDETVNYEEKVKKYTELAINHIKEFIII